MNRIEPRESIEHVISRWPVLVLCGVVGGLVAFVFVANEPPLYDATAVLSVSLIPPDRNPPLDLSDLDRSAGKVAAHLQSADVFEQTLRSAEIPWDSEPVVSVEDFARHSRLDRKREVWELVVTDPDPEKATVLVNAWAEIAENAFWEAFSHALAAETMQAEIDQLNSELLDLRMSDIDQADMIASLEAQRADLEADIIEQLRLAQGVVTFMTVHLVDSASIPDQPVARDTYLLIVSGTLMGVVAGLVILFGYEYFRESIERGP